MFNFFSLEESAEVYYFNRLAIIPGDSVTFDAPNLYTSENVDDKLNIMFKGERIFSFTIGEGNLNGPAEVRYAFLNQNAIQAFFSKGRLEGLLYSYTREGNVIEVMKFKRGRYKRHLYHFSYKSPKSLKALSKRRKKSPFGMN